MKRTDITFLSEGLRCAGWLYLPIGNGPHPCIVLAHGFGAVKEGRLDAYAEEFANAGLAALVFDYRHLGGSEGEPRQLIDIKKQLQDWRAAIVYARARPEIDGARIALWGTSFSGGHVISTAAQDNKLAAVVAQVPFTDGIASANANPFTTALRLTFAWARDLLRQLTGRPPFYIKVVGAPGSTAAMTSPNAEQEYQAMLPPQSNWKNETAARIMVPTIFYRPVKVAARIKCPLLICLCHDDDITPAAPARTVARIAPKGELLEFPGRHFDLYQGENFARAVAAQIEFYSRHLHPQARQVTAPA